MIKRRLQTLSDDQGGMILIEIVISAMLLVIVALGVFTAFDAGTRATAEERHRARAHSIAEGDVERMRAMQISDLSGLDATRTVTLDGLNYMVRSTATFGDEPATTSTCTTGTGSRDVLQVTSRVTWASIGTRPPVTVTSVVSPPNGSVVPNSGSLVVSVKDSRAVGVSGVVVTGSGAGSFSGTTAAGGCVSWKNLPAGTYNLNFGGAASSMVDEQGDPPGTETASVVAGGTNTAAFVFDRPGGIQDITFQTRNYTGTIVPSTADGVIVNQTGMNTARTFTTATRVAQLDTPNTLFPFTSVYDPIYAGRCSFNEPVPLTAPATGSALVPVGGTVVGPVLRLPALLVTVRDGTGPGASTQGNPVANAVITAYDDNCNVARTLTTATDTAGRVPTASIGNVGLPYSTNYDLCARNQAGTDHRKQTDVAVTSLASTGTAVTLYIGGTANGTCP